MLELGSPGFERVFSWMGDEARTSFADGLKYAGGVAPDYRGWFIAWLPSTAVNAEWAGLTVEVGTYDTISVVDGIRMDRWLKFGKGVSTASRDEIRATMLDRLYPADPEWRKLAIEAGMDAQARALNGLLRW
jgi:hypothetical protein